MNVELLVREDLVMSSAPIAVETLGTLGISARTVVERDVDLAADRLVWMGGNPRWYRSTIDRIAALPQHERPVVLVWHTEPLPMPRAAGMHRQPLTTRELAKIVLRDRRVNDHYSNARYLRMLARSDVADALVVGARAYQAYLAEKGIDVHHVPLGYHPSQGRLLDLERDIDVLFLGEYRLRRRKRILRRLRREGIDVMVLGDYSDPKLWGEARTKLLNRAKIMLHIPRLEGHCSDIRMNITMANGPLLVSEPLCLPDPFVPGVHHVEAPVDELPATIARYITDDESRKRITSEAHRFLTTELTLERSFNRLLDLAREATLRAA
jgi:hypothetical protein